MMFTLGGLKVDEDTAMYFVRRHPDRRLYAAGRRRQAFVQSVISAEFSLSDGVFSGRGRDGAPPRGNLQAAWFETVAAAVARPLLQAP